ncbi:helix-turn-helix domain-containing protein [Pseudokineococcus sp. 1T1Z-3]|uniref:helix-turn-helix domain-containing protein n=1 Tax=Pseudokineococcus sp. 1T1Z-3 TaxID=3132745 RepID=UPI0030B78B40
MEPDSARHAEAAPPPAAEPVAPDALDLVERAHLRRPDDTSHTLARYPPPPGLAHLVQRSWFPVWSVPPGEESVQEVLQHPVCLLVVTPTYDRFYRVTSGLSRTVLTGDGWAAGVMLTPAAGYLLARRPLTELADRHVPLVDVLPRTAARLVQAVRSAMADDPAAPSSHAAAARAYAEALADVGPVDAEGEVVERVVAVAAGRRDLTRVDDLCAAVDLPERALQRLTRRRVGLSPKWLVQRRRLHEAAELVRAGTTPHAEIAAMLGYADQAHFVRDFSHVTGRTPGALAAQHRASP